MATLYRVMWIQQEPAQKEKKRKAVGNLNLNSRKKFAELIIEKGSICINGISLTAFEVGKKKFKAAIIPYTFEHTDMKTLKVKDIVTFEHTDMKTLKVKDIVNLEFDVLGKYILRRLSLK